MIITYSPDQNKQKMKKDSTYIIITINNRAIIKKRALFNDLGRDKYHLVLNHGL